MPSAFGRLDEEIGRLDVVAERVVRGDRPPVGSEVQVQGARLDGDLVPDHGVQLAQTLHHDRPSIHPRQRRERLQQVDVDVHRLEAVIDADAIRPPRDRSALVPAGDRRPVPAHRLEVAAMLRVVRVLIQPVEGIAGDLECQLVAGDLADRAGGVDHERDAIGVLLVAEPGIEAALRDRASSGSPRAPCRASPGPGRRCHGAHNPRTHRGGPGNIGRRPPPSRSSGPGRPGTCRDRDAATNPGRMSGGSRHVLGRPPAGTSRGSIPRVGAGRSFPGVPPHHHRGETGGPARARAREEKNQRERNDPAWQ